MGSRNAKVLYEPSKAKKNDLNRPAGFNCGPCVPCIPNGYCSPISLPSPVVVQQRACRPCAQPCPPRPQCAPVCAPAPSCPAQPRCPQMPCARACPFQQQGQYLPFNSQQTTGFPAWTGQQANQVSQPGFSAQNYPGYSYGQQRQNCPLLGQQSSLASLQQQVCSQASQGLPAVVPLSPPCFQQGSSPVGTTPCQPCRPVNQQCQPCQSQSQDVYSRADSAFRQALSQQFAHMDHNPFQQMAREALRQYNAAQNPYQSSQVYPAQQTGAYAPSSPAAAYSQQLASQAFSQQVAAQQAAAAAQQAMGLSGYQPGQAAGLGLDSFQAAIAAQQALGLSGCQPNQAGVYGQDPYQAAALQALAQAGAYRQDPYHAFSQAALGQSPYNQSFGQGALTGQLGANSANVAGAAVIDQNSASAGLLPSVTGQAGDLTANGSQAAVSGATAAAIPGTGQAPAGAGGYQNPYNPGAGQNVPGYVPQVPGGDMYGVRDRYLFNNKFSSELDIKGAYIPKYNVEVQVHRPQPKVKEYVIPLPLPYYCKPRNYAPIIPKALSTQTRKSTQSAKKSSPVSKQASSSSSSESLQNSPSVSGVEEAQQQSQKQTPAQSIASKKTASQAQSIASSQKQTSSLKPWNANLSAAQSSTIRSIPQFN